MPHLPHATPAGLGLDEGRLQSAYDRQDEWTSGKNPPIPGGTILSYQSMGTLVTAEIAQRLTGQTIHDYIDRQIIEPLGLQSTRLGSQGLDEQRLVRVQTPDWQGKDFGWNSQYWRGLGAPWG